VATLQTPKATSETCSPVGPRVRYFIRVLRRC
jgi:hypothetical protein